MNILTGTITEIITEDEISLVKVLVQDCILTSIVIDTPATAAYLQNGRRVQLLFKPTEVILSKTFPLAISVRNKLYCTVKKILSGKILCQIELALDAGPVIRSIVTHNACEEMDLKENDQVLALIKTNEVSLSAHD